ncbi:cupin domain-containing protein [Methyloceanibacter sp.]|uniref:cupin domain-containing protein n=1 Tax=Methyloceanibacter sp. TaxID=1965321 RepID=UPI002D6C3E4A|nr:cupin domain-containing protein [Methyloceanibacter sp.]HZP10426.1 cupin domain-containing protein [Methyloceanibacter sp.]
MSHSKVKGRLGRSLNIAALALGASLAATAAFAGECPADQQKPNATAPVDYKPVGVTDTVIAMIDVEKEPANIKDRKFRMRKLTIEPGGIVPWHSHQDRPAIIYIVEGEINEYASNCAVPLVHKAGDVVAETSGVSHWWKNTGDKTVVLLSADLLKDPNDKNM